MKKEAKMTEKKKMKEGKRMREKIKTDETEIDQETKMTRERKVETEIGKKDAGNGKIDTKTRMTNIETERKDIGIEMKKKKEEEK